MAHLTCETHKRRALVIEPDVNGPLTRLIHRQDGSRCDVDGFVKYRGHIRTSFTVLIGKLPKTQALTKKEQREQKLREGIDLTRQEKDDQRKENLAKLQFGILQPDVRNSQNFSKYTPI